MNIPKNIQLHKHGRIPEKDVEKLERIYESKDEVREMLITALENDKREIYKRGKREGKREGGIQQQTEIARKMVIDGFDLPRIAKLTGLSEKVILQLKQEMEN